MIYLDTHVVVWLYVGNRSVFGARAQQAINSYPLLISPVVKLELTYLYEIGRVRTSPPIMLEYLSDRIGLKMCDLPFVQVISAAVHQTWTRDPFDRILVGQAAIQRNGFVTKDRIIREHYDLAIW